MSSFLLLLDESGDEPGWYNVLPPSSIYDGAFKYPDIMLEWAPTTQPTDASQTWVNITERLREWSWGYGRNDELGRFEAGTGTLLLDNRDRALDPSYNAGPWYGNIKPRRMFRLRYRWNGVVYPGFVAYSRGFPQAWPAAGYDSVVKVDVVDAFAILQSVDLVVGFSRPVEDSGTRISWVLEAAGIPVGLRDLDTGTVEVEAFEVTSAGTSALDHAKQVAEAENGQFFIAKDGSSTFHNRDRRLNASSLHTFTDDPAGTLRYMPGLEPAWDDTYLWNYVRVTGSAENTEAVAEDTASQDDYHKIVKAITSILADGGDRTALAEYLIRVYKQPQLRAPALPVNGRRDPAVMWPVLLGIEVSDRVTVERFSQEADPMVLVQNVEGIRHTCTPGGPWQTAITSSPADETIYWTLDHVTRAEIDSIYPLAA